MSHVISALIIFMLLKNLGHVSCRVIGSTLVKMCGWIKEHFM